MSDDIKHTPLPWVVRTHPALGSFVEAKIAGKPYGQEILGDDYFPNLDREADCEFIVRACNNYSEMVNALKRALPYVEAKESVYHQIGWASQSETDAKYLRELISRI